LTSWNFGTLEASAGTWVAVADATVGALGAAVSTAVMALSLSVNDAESPDEVRAQPSGTSTV